MEKEFIEQLLKSNISLKRIKSIIDKADTNIQAQNLNETTTANTCGLRILTCQGCHKSMFEDKFMLNKTNKRYRSCINCVMRAKKSRENKKLKSQEVCYDNKILALLDKEYNDVGDDDKISLEEVNDNSNISIASIETQDVIDEPIIPIVKTKQVKPKKNINNNQPEREPEEVSLRFFNLFNSK